MAARDQRATGWRDRLAAHQEITGPITKILGVALRLISMFSISHELRTFTSRLTVVLKIAAIMTNATALVLLIGLP